MGEQAAAQTIRLERRLAGAPREIETQVSGVVREVGRGPGHGQPFRGQIPCVEAIVKEQGDLTAVTFQHGLDLLQRQGEAVAGDDRLSPAGVGKAVAGEEEQRLIAGAASRDLLAQLAEDPVTGRVAVEQHLGVVPQAGDRPRDAAGIGRPIVKRVEVPVDVAVDADHRGSQWMSRRLGIGGFGGSGIVEPDVDEIAHDRCRADPRADRQRRVADPAAGCQRRAADPVEGGTLRTVNPITAARGRHASDLVLALAPAWDAKAELPAVEDLDADLFPASFFDPAELQHPVAAAPAVDVSLPEDVVV